MKYTFIIFLSSLVLSVSQAQEMNTSGKNSPAVIARNFSSIYGVRADAIEAILWIYDAKGYDADRRKRATEQILKMYAETPEKNQKKEALSPSTLQKMGITNNNKIASALEWDLFARKYYLSTTGQNSPAILAKGDVNIWYGIPPPTLRALAKYLEEKEIDLTDFEIRLAEQAKKYEELKEELATYGNQEAIYQQAEALLEEGKLEEAEQLIDKDYYVSRKRQAYKGYVFGKTKELVLKYKLAAIGYRDAVTLDEKNIKYHQNYAQNESTLANYEEAAKHYEIALRLNTELGNNKEVGATLYNNIGSVWEAKENYDKALEYYKKALAIDKATYGENHSRVANRYNNIGAVLDAKGDYEEAQIHYEKALAIFLKTHGPNHPNVAVQYNNLGLMWDAKGEYEKALAYYEKSLAIDRAFFGENHPDIAINYNNIGATWDSKGDYDQAIFYYKKALAIDQSIFGENHPKVATRYNNIGLAWYAKEDYDQALFYYNKSLAIDKLTVGEKHPSVATTLSNIGTTWYAKRDYVQAIDYFKQARTILEVNSNRNHPNRIIVIESLSRANNSRGLEFFQERKYGVALSYFQKALENADAIEDITFSLVCLSNIGSMQKLLRRYEEGLKSLDLGLQRSRQVNTKNILQRRMQYHKIGCLQGLGRKKEAEALAQKLWEDCLVAGDKRNLADLRKAGYNFE